MLLIFLMFVQGITIEAFDTPNDDGSSVTISWQTNVEYTLITILRSEQPDGVFATICEARVGRTDYQDTAIVAGQAYFYQVKAQTIDGEITSNIAGPARASVQLFNIGRLNIFMSIIILFAAILLYISLAKRQQLFIRKIPALTAMDEAIGRATEMGKPVLYVPGIMDIDDPQTIASMSILSKIAEKTAAYGTTLYVPTARAMAMSMAQQVVKEAAMKVGRPDWFNADNIRYLTDDQFGYVSGVDGIMLREKPATNFYLGVFYAESLILAETGHATGAIQIAGTAMPDQLPFFVAACDYTLLGEELYAASAYLSQEPVQLGSLKGQDLGKLIFVLVIIMGVIANLFGIQSFYNLFTSVH
ncbi:hypothetical protein JXB22_00255 [candidate division WOR-3 bacterium]|nr:hypothetical protein [candidate division WOR-3 bacterium]